MKKEGKFPDDCQSPIRRHCLFTAVCSSTSRMKMNWNSIRGNFFYLNFIGFTWVLSYFGVLQDVLN